MITTRDQKKTIQYARSLIALRFKELANLPTNRDPSEQEIDMWVKFNAIIKNQEVLEHIGKGAEVFDDFIVKKFEKFNE